MTRLLVSVRSAEEAALALRGGADVIDIKEPSRGSLGAAAPSVWQAVAETIDGERPVSIALGELAELTVCEPPPDGITYAKVGLAGMALQPAWQAAWRTWAAALPATIQPVAVAYVDWRSAAAPDPLDVIAAAAGRASIVLFDTWNKSRGGLFDLVPPHTLQDWLAAADARGLAVALAGSLTLAQIDVALELGPAIIAVRGAACETGRESALVEERVRALALRAHRATAAR